MAYSKFFLNSSVFNAGRSYNAKSIVLSLLSLRLSYYNYNILSGRIKYSKPFYSKLWYFLQMLSLLRLFNWPLDKSS